MSKRISVKQIKIFHSLLYPLTLKNLINDKINSMESLQLAKLLAELLDEAEREELTNKIFNGEVR